MGIEDMTPDELRAYAARKEAAGLFHAHTGGEAAPAPQQAPARPWERLVESGGHVYALDMRRFKSREFLQLLIKAKDAEEQGKPATLLQFELFDYAFAPIEGEIAAQVVEKAGYEDYEEYYTVCADLFEKVEAKN